MGNLIFVIIDQKKIIDLNQFEGTIWAKYDIMEQTFKHYDFGLKVEEILEKKTDNDIKSHKCNRPVWLCILTGKRFEDTFEKAQWRKIKQMQPMWLCILSRKHLKYTFENT